MNLAALESQFGLPPGLLDAVMQTESGGNPNAVSPKGAVGPFQFMPATAAQYGIDPRNPEQAATGAAKMLRDLLTKYRGDVPSALAAYNWGQGNVDRMGLDKAPAETKNYIQKVTGSMQIDPSKVQWDNAGIDPSKVQWDAPAKAPSNPDAALGGTLQLGIPFTGKRFDTGISLPPSVESGLVAAGHTVGDWINGTVGGNQKDAAAEAAISGLEKAHPVSTFVGNAAPYFAAGSSIPAMMALSAAGTGTPLERVERAAIAGAGGMAGKGVARLFGPQSMAGVPNAATDFADYAASQGNKWGIPTTTGMNGSKTAQLAESVIANMPFVNSGVNKARTAAYQGFNRAVSKTFGEDAAQITPELLGGARSSIGSTIGDIAGRNNISVSKNLFNGLQAVQQRAAQELTPEQARIVNAQVQNIWNAVDPQTGSIPGTLYKAFQSKFGELGKTNGGTMSSIMHDLRAAMRTAMTESVSPEDAAAWLKANEQYFNLQQVANATKQTPGSLSPSKLLSQVNSAQTAAKFGGGNNLAELAQWAKPTLSDQIPNSGTPQRQLMQRILTNPITGMAELAGLGYGLSKTDSPYAYGGLGLLAPLLVGKALAGQPASALTRNLLTRAGGTAGLLGYNALTSP